LLRRRTGWRCCWKHLSEAQPQPTSANLSPLRASASILSSGGNACATILALRVSKPGFDGRAHGRAGSQKRAAQLTAMDSICRAALEYKCLFVSKPANNSPLAACRHPAASWPRGHGCARVLFPRGAAAVASRCLSRVAHVSLLSLLFYGTLREGVSGLAVNMAA
jgi:hypothetical protein